MHELGTVSDGFFRHDDAETVPGVATGGVNAMAGTAPGDDGRFHACRREHLVDVGSLEDRRVRLRDDLLIRSTLEAGVQPILLFDGKVRSRAEDELVPSGARYVGRIVVTGREEDGGLG